MRRLRHLLPICAFLLVTATQVLAASVCPIEAPCVETCPDDDDSGHCPPSCACMCHVVRAPVVMKQAVGSPAPAVSACLQQDATIPASPDPEPLRHVPRSA